MENMAIKIITRAAQGHREPIILRRASHLIMNFLHASASQLRNLRAIATWCLATAPELIDLVVDIGHYLLKQGLSMGLELILHCRTDIVDVNALNYLLPQKLSSSATMEKQRQLIRECNTLLFFRMKTQYEQGKGVKWCYKSPVLSFCNPSYDLCLLQLPRNFSWVSLKGLDNDNESSSPHLPYLLAGSAIPTSASQIAALSGVGIRRIITVHEESLSITLCPTVAINHALALVWTVSGWAATPAAFWRTTSR